MVETDINEGLVVTSDFFGNGCLLVHLCCLHLKMFGKPPNFMMNVIENHNFSQITWHFDGNFMGIYPVFRHAMLKQIV